METKKDVKCNFQVQYFPEEYRIKLGEICMELKLSRKELLIQLVENFEQIKPLLMKNKK